MISIMQKFRRFFLTISLSILLITVAAFGFGSMDSSASSANNLPRQFATKDKVELKNPKIMIEEEADTFKAKSLELIDKSIVNPDYQPGGKTKELTREDNRVIKDIKIEAGESMDSLDK